MKIAIFGIGGVGGYLGGLLAAKYHNDPQVEIIFIARGEHGAAIKEHGLTLYSTMGEIHAVPDLVTDNPAECGEVDYLLYCTKSYDVENSIASVRGFLGEKSVLVPFLNGVDGEQKIREMLPSVTVWSGCVFIVSEKMAPGVIRQGGGIAKYFFGGDNSDKRLPEFEKICQDANIEMIYDRDIERRVWEKFSFISAVASFTTYLGKSVGEIMASDRLRETLQKIMCEFIQMAECKGIKLSDNLLEKNMSIVLKMPSDATSSMQRDYAVGNKSEVESLTGYVVRAAKECGAEVPLYNEIYSKIK